MLIVIFESLKEEDLPPAPVEPGPGNDERTADISTRVIVGVVWFELAHTGVIIEVIVRIHDMIAGEDIRFTLERASARLGYRIDDHWSLRIFRGEVRGKDFHFRDHIRVRVDGSSRAKRAGIKSILAVLGDAHGLTVDVR